MATPRERQNERDLKVVEALEKLDKILAILSEFGPKDDTSSSSKNEGA